MIRLIDLLDQPNQEGYAYAYPHKSAYRELEPPVSLGPLWQKENLTDAFLYFHVPFCEMRCGFCNLFTSVQPKADFLEKTIQSTLRQSRILSGVITPEKVGHLAFGGGTPSFVPALQLRHLFEQLGSHWSLQFSNVQTSFETSPGTIDDELLKVLREFSVDRISMGVQSFAPAELKQLGRPQSIPEVFAAVEKINNYDFPILNLDLIYGMQDQTIDSWLESVSQTIELSPEEIFLYPLYVRSLTGLDRTGKTVGQQRRELYLAAREVLLDAGYIQDSMRLFRRKNVSVTAQYCCQEEGMIGLGPGARSYTRELHYSSEYAVSRTGVRSIIQDFCEREEAQFLLADYGTWLNLEEQKRRYVIKSILKKDGLDVDDYRQWFGSEVYDEFEQLNELGELKFANLTKEKIQLTPLGLSHSDFIGPWLYSESVKTRMEAFEVV